MCNIVLKVLCANAVRQMKNDLSLSPYDVLAALLFTSTVGMPIAGYNLQTAFIIFVVHSATYGCMLRTPPKKTTHVTDEYDII